MLLSKPTIFKELINQFPFLRKARQTIDNLFFDPNRLEYLTALRTYLDLFEYAHAYRTDLDSDERGLDIPVIETHVSRKTHSVGLSTYLSTLPIGDCVDYCLAYLKRYMTLRLPAALSQSASARYPKDADMYLQTALWIYSILLPELKRAKYHQTTSSQTKSEEPKTS